MFTREFEVQRCPLCGSIMMDGRCGDTACEFHWRPAQREELLEFEIGEEAQRDAG